LFVDDAWITSGILELNDVGEWTIWLDGRGEQRSGAHLGRRSLER
jgi:hypothetical protein